VAGKLRLTLLAVLAVVLSLSPQALSLDSLASAPLWAENRYFSLAFSRKAVDRQAAHTLILRPR